MAITVTLGNNYYSELLSGNIDFDGDDIKIILMDTTFAFDPDSDDKLSDVTAEQLSTGYGYTQDSKILTGAAVTLDDANNRAYVTFDDPSWTASGGSIGPTGAAIIYDDTHADDVVIGCIDFGTDYTITTGNTITLEDIQINNGTAAP